MKDKSIIEKYKGKVLGEECWGNCNKLFVEDFLGEDDLLHELYEMDCHEIFLTDEGLRFLEEYYTFDYIVTIISQEIERGVEFKYSNKEDIIMWLNSKGAYNPEKNPIYSVEDDKWFFYSAEDDKWI